MRFAVLAVAVAAVLAAPLSFVVQVFAELSEVL